MSAFAKASAAQAKEIARLWSEGKQVSVADGPDAYVWPTHRAMIVRGWLDPTDDCGVYPSGAPYRIHAITPLALEALERFLFDQRCARKAAA